MKGELIMITLKTLKNSHCTMCGKEKKYIRELRIDDSASIIGDTKNFFSLTYIRLCNNCCLSKIMIKEKQPKHVCGKPGNSCHLYDFAAEEY